MWTFFCTLYLSVVHSAFGGKELKLYMFTLSLAPYSFELSEDNLISIRIFVCHCYTEHSCVTFHEPLQCLCELGQNYTVLCVYRAVLVLRMTRVLPA